MAEKLSFVVTIRTLHAHMELPLYLVWDKSRPLPSWNSTVLNSYDIWTFLTSWSNRHFDFPGIWTFLAFWLSWHFTFLTFWPSCHFDLNNFDLPVILTFLLFWLSCHFDFPAILTFLPFWPTCHFGLWPSDIITFYLPNNHSWQERNTLNLKPSQPKLG